MIIAGNIYVIANTSCSIWVNETRKMEKTTYFILGRKLHELQTLTLWDLFSWPDLRVSDPLISYLASNHFRRITITWFCLHDDNQLQSTWDLKCFSVSLLSSFDSHKNTTVKRLRYQDTRTMTTTGQTLMSEVLISSPLGVGKPLTSDRMTKK